MVDGQPNSHDSEHLRNIDAAMDAIVIPWDLGGLFYRYGFRDHSRVLYNLLDAFCPEVRVVRTNTPEMIDLFVNRTCEGDAIVQLLNLTGANGMSVGAHIPVHDIEVELPPDFVGEPRSLTGSDVRVESRDGKRILRVTCLEQYDAIVFE